MIVLFKTNSDITLDNHDALQGVMHFMSERWRNDDD